MTDDGRCGRKTRSGKPCRAWPVAGTDVCRMHGGGAPQVKAAAERRLAQAKAHAAVVTLGLPVEIDPHQALLEEVHRAAGVVAWVGMQVAELERQQVVHGVTKTIQLPDGGRRIEAQAAINVWVRLYGEERDRLVRASKAAVDAGVSERLVRVEEEKGRLIAEVLQRVIDAPDVGLTDDQRQSMRTVAARELRALPGGQAA